MGFLCPSIAPYFLYYVSSSYLSGNFPCVSLMNSRIFSSLLFQVFFYITEHFHHLTDGGFPDSPWTRRAVFCPKAISCRYHFLWFLTLYAERIRLEGFFAYILYRQISPDFLFYTQEPGVFWDCLLFVLLKSFQAFLFQDFELYSDNGFLCVHLDRRIRFLLFLIFSTDTADGLISYSCSSTTTIPSCHALYFRNRSLYSMNGFMIICCNETRRTMILADESSTYVK